MKILVDETPQRDFLSVYTELKHNAVEAMNTYSIVVLCIHIILLNIMVILCSI